MIITEKNLAKLREDNKDKKIVLAIGTFDLFHYEHLRYLQDAKKLGDILVVIVKNNALASEKGLYRPIIDEKQRVEIIDGLKCVDYSILTGETESIQQIQKMFGEQDKLTTKFLSTFYPIISKLRPDILYHEDSQPLQPARNLLAQKFDIQLVERHRTAIVTTSKIIKKILG